MLHRSDMNKYTFITSASHAHFTPIIRAFCLIPRFLLCIYGKLQIICLPENAVCVAGPRNIPASNLGVDCYETKAIERNLFICTDQNVPRGMSLYLTTVKCHLCCSTPTDAQVSYPENAWWAASLLQSPVSLLPWWFWWQQRWHNQSEVPTWHWSSRTYFNAWTTRLVQHTAPAQSLLPCGWTTWKMQLI